MGNINTIAIVFFPMSIPGLPLSIANGAKPENFEQMAPKSKHWQIYWQQVIPINAS